MLNCVFLFQNDSSHSRPGSSLTVDLNVSHIGPNAPNTTTTPLTTTQRPSPMKRNSNTLDQTLTNEVLLSVQDHFKRPVPQDDHFDIFGKNVAMKLRDLAKEQRILAENIINEALFLAKMDTLTIGHTISGPLYNKPPLVTTVNRAPMQQYATLSPIICEDSSTATSGNILQPYNVENNATYSQDSNTAAFYLSQFGRNKSS